jgi:hypothetical protein
MVVELPERVVCNELLRDRSNLPGELHPLFTGNGDGRRAAGASRLQRTTA